MKKHKLNESVSLNESIIVEAGEEILVFTPSEYKAFTNNKNGKVKVTERIIKEEDQADANQSKGDDKKSGDDEKKDSDEKKDDKKDESLKTKVEPIKEQEGMTVGEQLIERFGLQDIENLYICKVSGSSVPIFHIVFDSYKRNLALTKSSITSKHNIDMVLGSGKVLTRSAFVHLKDFHGSPNGLFILNDLAGSYMGTIEF